MKMYLGTMGHKTVEQSYNAIKEALRVGYFGIDSAKIYGNEEIVGRALIKLKEEGIKPKIQTKIWTDDFDVLEEEFNNMLGRLGVDKVYSLMLHRPSMDFHKTIEAWRKLIKLQADGKVEEIGVSNFDKDMLYILEKETGVKPSTNQVEMSITNFRADRLHYCLKNNIEIQAWSPMGKDPMTIVNNKLVRELAEKYNTSVWQIALSYLSSQGIITLSGATEVEQIEQNFNHVTIAMEDIAALAKLNTYTNKFEELFPY